MPDLIKGELPVLVDQASEAHKNNGLGVAATLQLMQEQADQGLPQTATPLSVVLDAITSNIILLTPALDSLAANAPPRSAEVIQSKLTSMSWSKLVALAKRLTGELNKAVTEQGGSSAESLGMEPLAFLQEDLSGIESWLPKLMDVSRLDGSAIPVGAASGPASAPDADTLG